MRKASLSVVGTGIKVIAQLTTEAKTYVEKADIVLYLVNDPVMKEWIQKANSHSESLDPIYTKFPLRLHCYRAITEHILETLHKNQHVCVVLYGHPTVFAKPALDAARQAKQEGYDTKILPGISAKDCLFADLMIDPGSCGCTSFEATDFLIHKRKFDPTSHLILWQVGFIAALGHLHDHNNINGAKILSNYLLKIYIPEHEVTLYEAAQYPGFEPRIESFPLAKLPEAKFSPLSTLYIPPANQAACDEDMLKLLGIDIKNLL